MKEGRRSEVDGLRQVKGAACWGWSTSDPITWALEGLCKDFNFHSDRNREQLWVLNRRMMQSHYRVANFPYIFKGSLSAVLKTGCGQVYKMETDQLKSCSHKEWWLPQ